MSKDAELLRAIGCGPEALPELWVSRCPKCRATTICGVQGSDSIFCLGHAYTRENPLAVCDWSGVKGEQAIVLDGNILGLDLDPSEWTTEHDANFARYVWPWLRGASKDSSVGGVSNRVILALEGFGHTAEWFTKCEYPGPTMCRAIYAVLCAGAESKS